MTFGAAHIAQILIGKRSKTILERGHDHLTTFGLLAGEKGDALSGYIDQLVDQGLLARDAARFSGLSLTPQSVRVMRGEHQAVLIAMDDQASDPPESVAPSRRPGPTPTIEPDPDSSALFEVLRSLRRELAEARGVPAYMILGDATLWELARIRPAIPQAFRRIKGIGDRKANDFAEPFVSVIDAFCRERNLKGDLSGAALPVHAREEGDRAPIPPRKHRAFALFARGTSIQAVARELGVVPSTASGYLCDFVEHERPHDISPWVDAKAYAEILDTARRLNADRLRPIYEHFAGAHGYDEIRVVLTHAACRKL